MKRGILFLILLVFFSLNVLAQSDTVTFNGTIPELTIKTGMNRNVLNLSEYFISNNTVTYKYKAGAEGIEDLIIEIESDGKVNIEAGQPGSRSTIFIADDDINAVQSNEVKIKISGDAIVTTSFSPNTDAVSLTENKEQIFAVSGNESVEWYLDDVKLNHTSNTYNLLGSGVGVHNVKVVAGSNSKTWTVSVLAESITNTTALAPDESEDENEGPVCGNNVKETGENCSNCASDVKCSANTRCENSVCVPIKQYGKLILWLVLLAAVIVFVVMSVILIRKKNINAGFFDKIKNLFKKDKDKKEETKIEDDRADKIEEVDLNPLVAYFKNNLGKYGKEALIDQATQQGWTEEQIKKAISLIDFGDVNDKNNKSQDDKESFEGKP